LIVESKNDKFRVSDRDVKLAKGAIVSKRITSRVRGTFKSD
jgi:hypothetical protein